MTEHALPAPMRPLKKWLFGALAAALGTLIALLLAEGVLQIVYGPVAHEITNAHPILHHFSGNNPSTNSFGFYDREYPAAKPHGSRRIMILGDSLVRRTYHELNFTQILEQTFQATPGYEGVEVWNCGIDSYSPALCYLLLKHKLLDLDPDTVVVCVFLGNDFNDDAVYQSQMVLDARGRPERCPPDAPSREARLIPGQVPIPFKNFLRYHSRLYRELSRGYNTLLHWLRFREGEWEKAAIGEDQTAPIGTLTVNISDSVFHILAQNLVFTDELLRERGIPWLAVLIPLHVEVNRLVEGGKRLDQYSEDGIRLADQNLEKLAAFLEEKRIPVLNLLPPFQASPSQPLFTIDSHFNEPGHRLAAELLYERLMSDKLLE